MKAPILVMDMLEPDYVAYGGFNPLTGVEGDWFTCHLCGHKLAWRVVVQDADGKRFVIGQDCSASIRGIQKGQVTNARKRAERRAADRKDLETSTAEVNQIYSEHLELLKTLPHPSSRHKAASLASYLEYWQKEGMDLATAKRVLKIVRSAMSKAQPAPAQAPTVDDLPNTLSELRDERDFLEPLLDQLAAKVQANPAVAEQIGFVANRLQKVLAKIETLKGK